jgi:hypothetical protein
MDVMFTTHPKDGPGKFYMVVASAEEWRDVLDFMKASPDWPPVHTSPIEMMAGLEGWGI